MHGTVLFACHENICRSSMVEGLFREAVLRLGDSCRFSAESAGTVCRQRGEPPDFRALSAARAFGVDISAHRARRTRDLRLGEYFRIFAMGHEDYHELVLLLDDARREDLFMLADYLPDPGVTAGGDPYCCPDDDFFAVRGMLSEAAENICEELLGAGVSDGASDSPAIG
ncbi:hypothetical protein CHL67_09855 [Prosthecochloris sp. GSB1]|uniref:arsenate reductase/protein-tyrosine-phosphatase family protein n=1 Tax=Prosthecochloris sp. GSB1 TaxID=281093 RepID=UPI000B8D050F|nr:hypothetical protein [Prosthecochloris sp. GSB1]ASQ91177.1 hypothetical protein CHL67_09855 [Prosthecochloris sp. GSB1]